VGNLRARILRSQQNRVQNRHLPFQGTSGFGSGGFVKESGGTGVFHPRILNTTTNSTTTSDTRRKQGQLLALCVFFLLVLLLQIFNIVGNFGNFLNV
jgi:hypothetical protein